jgi:hypothetical protein
MAISNEAIGMLIPQASAILSDSLSPPFALPLPTVTTSVFTGKFCLIEGHNGKLGVDLLEVES